jgi:aminopeptidase N
VLLSNGNLRERGTTDGGKRHYAVWKDPHPKPSAICLPWSAATSALGRLVFETMSGDAVDLRIYVEPSKEDRCAWAMDSLKRSMTWDEKRYGRAYDLDVFNIVAVSDFNMGAMENKGLNVFNAAYDPGDEPRRRRMRTSRASRASSPTSTSTTGPATASPAATGSSSA